VHIGGRHHHQATRRHERRAERHESRAASWDAIGDQERAQLERLAADIQRDAVGVVRYRVSDSPSE